MHRVSPAVAVGNDFVLPRRSLPVVTPTDTVVNEVRLPEVQLSLPEPTPPEAPDPASLHPEPPDHFRVTWSGFIDFLHRHSISTFALLILFVGAAGVQVAGAYMGAQASSVAPAPKPQTKSIAGLNSTIPAAEFDSKLQAIINQPVTLNLGTKVVPVSPETIKSWLQITPSKDGSKQYVHVKTGAISESMTKLAQSQVKAPINQVAVSRNGIQEVIVHGRDGTTLTNPETISEQAKQFAKTVMDGKGLEFSTPLVVQPMQTLTPASFGKLIEVDVNSKQMWAYQNGELVRSFAVSAGAPETPTPIGQFKIFSKLPIQDMRGFNADGTRYFQPKVKYVSYFKSGGYAIHGNYWRPLSWFGQRNSSHGCVSVPDSTGESKWIYDFGSIGTTVIVHT